MRGGAAAPAARCACGRHVDGAFQNDPARNCPPARRGQALRGARPVSRDTEADRDGQTGIQGHLADSQREPAFRTVSLQSRSASVVIAVSFIISLCLLIDII